MSEINKYDLTEDSQSCFVHNGSYDVYHMALMNKYSKYSTIGEILQWIHGLGRKS